MNVLKMPIIKNSLISNFINNLSTIGKKEWFLYENI
jgi:hypothetical protein